MKRLEILVILGIFPSLVFSDYDGWTMWYNTDKPYSVGDIELYDRIKQAYYVCGSKKPYKAQCRVVGTNDHFTYETSQIAPDYLFRPCSNTGIVCRNEDQPGSAKCHDYEIRFFCPQYDDSPTNSQDTTNFWMIALVGAACIIAPLLCVVVLQCYREVRTRRLARERLRNRQVITGEGDNSTPEAEHESAQPPPSYQTLFGSDSQSTESLINTNRASGIRHSISRLFGLSNTEVRSSSDNEQTDTSTISQISSGAVYPSDLQTQTPLLNSNERPAVHSNRRFPGMHISIFDAFSTQGEEILTPPPSYKDAIIIIGECPPKYTEADENK